MTLTLVKSPPAVSLVENEILFKVNTNNQYSNIGVLANLGIKWTIGDNVDDSFSLSWGSNSVAFTAKTSPDDSGLQYTAYISGDINAWMEQVAIDLAKNYLLTTDFEVSWNASQNLVQVRAREKGTDNSLTLDTGTSNVLQDSNTAGIDPVTREFYNLICNIFIYDPAENLNWRKLGEARLDPDTDGNVLFKIQEYLVEELTPQFTYPEDYENKIVKLTDFIKQFHIEYAETYDNEVKKLSPTSETETLVIPGKVSKQHAIRLAELEMSFFDEIKAMQMFLTWHPLSKIISKWQPEKLYYLNFTKASGLNFIRRTYFTNGISNINTISSYSNCGYDVYEICCGHDLMGLQYLSNTVDKYQLYVTNQDDEVISVIMEFVIDASYQEFEQVFLFANSFKAFETFRTTGIQSKTNRFDHKIIELVKEEGDLGWTEENNHQSWMEETFKASSGWISKEVLDWTNEFILSTERYIIENHQLFPIVVTSKKVFQHKDQEELYSIDFEFKKSIKAEAYGKMDALNPWQNESAINILTEDEELILI